MISSVVKTGDRVEHDMFGLGTVTGFETKKVYFFNFLLVKFDNYPGISVINPLMVELKDVKS